MPLDDLDYDDATWSVAYHEAGHLVAAVLCGLQWTEAWIDPHGLRDEFMRGVVRMLSRDDTPAADIAFFYWAGSYAQARYEAGSGDPWLFLQEIQDECGAADMLRVWDYWNDPTHAPHETDEQWAIELDKGWATLERWAEQLVRAGHVESAAGALL